MGYNPFYSISDKMQRLLSVMKTITSMASLPVKSAQTSMFDSVQQFSKARLLQPILPIINPVCSFKVRGRLRRRCKSCYFVVRDERLYVICPKFPRHKQMAMKAKPLNTWILTHATQSPVRPW